MRLRQVIAICTLLGACIASAGDSWMSYRSSDGTYSVAFPGKPKVMAKSYQTKAGVVPAELVIYGQNDQAFCTMSLDGSRMPSTKGRENALLNVAVGAIGATNGFKLLAEESFKMGKYEGRHLVLSKDVAEIQLYAILKDQYVLLVAYLGRPGTTDGPDAQKFIASFKVK
ncbi:MAG: hypothetical protein IT203_02290 [Fimbriimonadaceae bacterium]|nr:hypothetical protein [Fimbriimonadaceae bacterium]